jgi:hypothetical protein
MIQSSPVFPQSIGRLTAYTEKWNTSPIQFTITAEMTESLHVTTCGRYREHSVATTSGLSILYSVVTVYPRSAALQDVRNALSGFDPKNSIALADGVFMGDSCRLLS